MAMALPAYLVDGALCGERGGIMNIIPSEADAELYHAANRVLIIEGVPSEVISWGQMLEAFAQQSSISPNCLRSIRLDGQKVLALYMDNPHDAPFWINYFARCSKWLPGGPSPRARPLLECASRIEHLSSDNPGDDAWKHVCMPDYDPRWTAPRELGSETRLDEVPGRGHRDPLVAQPA